MDVLDGITKSNNATAPVLIVVIIAVVLILISIPIYKTMVKAQETKRKQYMDREQILINVVEKVSTAMTELSTVLKGSNKSCSDCKREQLAHFERIHAGINRVETVIGERLERRG